MEACALTGRRSTRTPADSSPAAAVGGQAGGWGPLAGVLSTSENKPATRSPRVGEASSPRGAVGEGWGARLARIGDHRNSSDQRMLFELSVIGKNGKLTRPVRTAAALGSSAHPLSPGTQDISFGVRGGPGEPCVGTPVSGSSLGRCPSQGGVCCRGCARAVWATAPPAPALRCSCDGPVSQSLPELVPRSGPQPDDPRYRQLLTPRHQRDSQRACAKGSGCFPH